MLRWTSRRAEHVIRQQIAFYRMLNDREVAVLLVGAATMRVWLVHIGAVPSKVFEVVAGDCYEDFKDYQTAAIRIGSLVEKAQKKKDLPEAVWLSSVRALYIPEINFVGKEMWAELSRGLAHLDGAFGGFSIMFGEYPEGLEDKAMDLLADGNLLVPPPLQPTGDG